MGQFSKISMLCTSSYEPLLENMINEGLSG